MTVFTKTLQKDRYTNKAKQINEQNTKTKQTDKQTKNKKYLSGTMFL